MSWIARLHSVGRLWIVVLAMLSACSDSTPEQTDSSASETTTAEVAGTSAPTTGPSTSVTAASLPEGRIDQIREPQEPVEQPSPDDMLAAAEELLDPPLNFSEEPFGDGPVSVTGIRDDAEVRFQMFPFDLYQLSGAAVLSALESADLVTSTAACAETFVLIAATPPGTDIDSLISNMLDAICP